MNYGLATPNVSLVLSNPYDDTSSLAATADDTFPTASADSTSSTPVSAASWAHPLTFLAGIAATVFLKVAVSWYRSSRNAAFAACISPNGTALTTPTSHLRLSPMTTPLLLIAAPRHPVRASIASDTAPHGSHFQNESTVNNSVRAASYDRSDSFSTLTPTPNDIPVEGGLRTRKLHSPFQSFKVVIDSSCHEDGQARDEDDIVQRISTNIVMTQRTRALT